MDFTNGRMENYGSINGFKSVHQKSYKFHGISKNVIKTNHDKNMKIQNCRARNFGLRFCFVVVIKRGIPNMLWINCAVKDLHRRRHWRYFIRRLQFGSFFVWFNQTIFYVSINSDFIEFSLSICVVYEKFQGIWIFFVSIHKTGNIKMKREEKRKKMLLAKAWSCNTMFIISFHNHKIFHHVTKSWIKCEKS